MFGGPITRGVDALDPPSHSVNKAASYSDEADGNASRAKSLLRMLVSMTLTMLTSPLPFFLTIVLRTGPGGFPADSRRSNISWRLPLFSIGHSHAGQSLNARHHPPLFLFCFFRFSSFQKKSMSAN